MSRLVAQSRWGQDSGEEWADLRINLEEKVPALGHGWIGFGGR